MPENKLVLWAYVLCKLNDDNDDHDDDDDDDDDEIEVVDGVCV